MAEEEFVSLAEESNETKLYELSNLSYSLRESLIGNPQVSVTLDKFLSQVDVDLNGTLPNHTSLIEFAVDTHSPAVLSYFLEKGVTYDKESCKALADKELNRLRGWFKDDNNIVLCAKQCLELVS